ncbi:facilitated trehalose transporter Tret1-like [Contarinia nasturtii]|uniref:facilitated trehalose transporter Tret1-like n=1 Tax=Contarinia nasturtii TaxID=265458 RepID=UPI0012D4B864|nr:facilitated trehalose transporter Tret1-like [Contarinia nasturtii]
MVKEHTQIVHESSAKNQYFAAFVVNLLIIGFGVTLGWSGPNLVVLKSNKSPLLTGKVTEDEGSWIASLLCFGCLIGNVFFGYVTSKFGRKTPLTMMTVPIIISWLLILFAQNVIYLYVSRILNGFVGGGLFVIVPAFLSEIAIDRIRGLLGATLAVSCNVGILLEFIFGYYFNFYAPPKFVIALTTVCGVLLYFLPESPSFLIEQNKSSEAEESIRFYQNLKGKDNNYELLQTEMNRLKNTVGVDDMKKSNEHLMKWSDLWSGPGKKAMMIGIFFVLLNQCCGCVAMTYYTTDIFRESGSSLDENICTIIVGVIQLIGAYIATFLVDRAGRKFLYVVSTVGITLGLTTFGIFMMLKTNGYDVEIFNWIPIASFSFVIFIASWAVLSLPFLVIAEIMPEKLKNFGPSFCMIILWSLNFVIVKYMPLLKATLGMHGMMFLFAGYSIVSAVLIVLFMPETKGRSYDEIMKLLE